MTQGLPCFAKTVAAALVALATGLAGGAALASGACAPDRVEIRGAGGKAAFQVDVVDDEASRARGLMFVTKLPQMSGMLFVYDGEQPVNFWMKNTLIPLDMIFIDSSGRVVNVHSNAQPHDVTPVPSAGPVRFVLEVNGGMAARLKIGPGSEMRHSSVAPEIAVWPCN